MKFGALDGNANFEIEIVIGSAILNTRNVKQYLFAKFENISLKTVKARNPENLNSD